MSTASARERAELKLNEVKVSFREGSKQIKKLRARQRNASKEFAQIANDLIAHNALSMDLITDFSRGLVYTSENEVIADIQTKTHSLVNGKWVSKLSETDGRKLARLRELHRTHRECIEELKTGNVTVDGKAISIRSFLHKKHLKIRAWASDWRDRLKDENWKPVIDEWANVEFHVYKAEVGQDDHAEFNDAFPEYCDADEIPPDQDSSRNRAKNAKERRWTIEEIGRRFPDKAREVYNQLTDAQKSMAAQYFIEGREQKDIAEGISGTAKDVCEHIGRIREKFTAAGLPPPEPPVIQQRVKELSKHEINRDLYPSNGRSNQRQY